MNKRGQFYILGAFIVVAMLLSFMATVNYARLGKKDNNKYEIEKELNYETAKLYDNIIFNNRNNEKDIIKNWLESYTTYYAGKKEKHNWIFLYGDKNLMTATVFSKNQDNLTFTANSVDFSLANNNTADFTPENIILVSYNSNSYLFKMKNGKNFFFIFD